MSSAAAPFLAPTWKSTPTDGDQAFKKSMGFEEKGGVVVELIIIFWVVA